MMTYMRWFLVPLIAGTLCLVMGCTSSSRDPGDARDQGLNGSNLPSWEASQQSETNSPDILPETHMAAGRLHESNGRFARAAEQYRLAIANTPDYYEAHNRLAVVLDQLRSHDAAEESFLRAVEIAPKQAHLHNNLGFHYVLLRQWSKAEPHLRQAVELSPEFTRARINLGMTLAQQERFGEAFEQFRAAVSLEDAYYNMGLMYQSRQRLVEAASSFKTALQLNPLLTAARKKLEKLPPDIVQRAEADLQAFEARPTLSTASDSGSQEPTTRPADDQTTRTD